MSEFMPGLELCRRFYSELVRPLFDKCTPDLPHSAALIGPGSEVLGFDTPMSMDHDWFPRVIIFLDEEDLRRTGELDAMLGRLLPNEFLGFPTRAQESPLEAGTLAMAAGEGVAGRHQVRFVTLAAFARQHLDWDMTGSMDEVHWLTTPSQVLRSLTAGAVYHDGLGVLEPFRRQLEWYPHDVWLYRMAGAWNQIGNEEHLMPRASYTGDELGSRVIAARLVQTIMRLCFLMEGQYAPYPKWLGSAFQGLRCAGEMSPFLWKVLDAESWQERQAAIVPAYEALARKHNALGLTDPLPETVSPFFGRPFQVIQASRFDAALCARITDPAVREIVEKRGSLGGIDELSDSTELRGNTTWWAAVRGVYR